MTNEIEKERCPNGYHHGEGGLCYHKVTGQVYENRGKEIQVQTQEIRQKGPNATDEEVRQRVEGADAKRTREYETYRVRQDSQEVKWATNSYGSDDASKEIRRKIIEQENEGKVFKFKAKAFSMKYEDGKYVRSDSSDGFHMDGITTTQAVYKDENGEYLPERAELHADIIRELLKDMPSAKEGTKPRILFTGGGSGTGKSSMKPKLQEAGWNPDIQTLDSDFIMTNFLPEYEELVKQDSRSSAFLAHDEASDILSMAIEECIKQRKEFIIDGTLKSKGKAIKMVNMLKEKGYEVSLRGIFMDPKQSWSNCTRRYINAKSVKNVRYVPKDVAVSSNIGFTRNCMDDDFINIFDDVEIYDRNDQSQNRVVISRKDGKSKVDNQELLDNAVRYAVMKMRLLRNHIRRDIMKVTKEKGHISKNSLWTFDDCEVVADESNYCFTVYMEQDGESRAQTINPSEGEFEQMKAELDSGESPVGAWEDGVGNLVSWRNAEVAKSKVGKADLPFMAFDNYYGQVKRLIADTHTMYRIPTPDEERLEGQMGEQMMALCDTMYSYIMLERYGMVEKSKEGGYTPSWEIAKSRRINAPVRKSKVGKHRIEIYQVPREKYGSMEAEERSRIFDLGMGTEYYEDAHPGEDLPLQHHDMIYSYEGDDSYEGVFSRFNRNHPADFTGRSLSVGDVVIIDGEAKIVDDFGFTPIAFRKTRKSTEETPEVTKSRRINAPVRKSKVGKSFTFEWNDGNSGDSKEFDNLDDAIKEADNKWNHLTDNEKKKYQDSSAGGCFYIADESGRFVWEPEEGVAKSRNPVKKKAVQKQSKPILSGRDAYQECCRIQKSKGIPGFTYAQVMDIMGARPDSMLHSMINKGKVRRIHAGGEQIYQFR